MKLDIRKKMLLYLMVSVALFYVLVVAYLLKSSYTSAYSNAALHIEQEANNLARSVSIEMESSLSMVRSLAQAFTIYQDMSEEEWQRIFSSMYVPIIERNPQILYIWDSWEYGMYKPGYTKETGRLAINVMRKKGDVVKIIRERGVDGNEPEAYLALREQNRELIMDPYIDEGPSGENELVVTYIVPIQLNGAFCGLVGFDVSMGSLQDIITKANNIQGSQAMLVTNTGIVASHPNESFVGQSISNVMPREVERQHLLEKIESGLSFSYLMESVKGNSIVYWAPVTTLKTNVSWMVGVSVPYDSIFDNFKQTIAIAVSLSILGIVAILIIIMLVSNSISRPIARMTQSLTRLADGEMSDELILKLNTGDELEEMANALNTSISGLNGKSIFAKAVGEGSYDASLELMSERDALGQSLLQMRDNLRRASDEEAQRRDEAQRVAWANEGHARFGEILRQHSDNLQLLCDDVVSEMARFLMVNQVALFLQHDDGTFGGDVRYSLKSAYAWNRKKHLRRDIAPGEGLVGACVLERAPIFMTDVPEGYINITSGLGEASPRCILLVPLKYEEEILGVIELAAFTPLEPHVVEFVERIADSLAGTVRNVRINARTRELLEQSQMQAEEMKSQEEEMRQNMEELQATQEEIARKTDEITGFVNSIQNASFVVEYDPTGIIIEVNEAYLALAGRSRDAVVGAHHSDWLSFTPEQQAEYGKFWDDLRAGVARKQRTRLAIQGRETDMLEVYIPVHDGDGRVVKVMKLGFLQSDFE